MATTASAQLAEKIAGQYAGDLYISLGEEINDETEPMPGQSLDVTAAVDATKGGVDLAIHNFSFGEAPLGDILLPSISVTTDSLNRVVFGKNESIELSFLDGAIMATAYLDETKSYISGNDIVAYINVMWTNNEPQIPIYVLFKGKIKKDEPAVNTPESLAASVGQYGGDLYISLGEEINDETEPMPKQTLEVTAAADSVKGGVDLAIHNFSFGEAPLGDILLPSISVTTDSLNRVVFGKNESIELSFLDGAIMATAYLDETKSYISGNDIVAYINVVWTNTDPDPQVPIYVLFKGSKKDTIVDAITLPTTTQKAADVVYDLLSGRRIKASEMQRHGIYLVNGKKVLK